MKFHFILFIVGVLFITIGYAKQMKPSCDKGVEVRFVPRNVFDEISQGKAYTERDDIIDLTGNFGLGVSKIDIENRKKEILERQEQINEETDV
jgi:hypothetical protein